MPATPTAGGGGTRSKAAATSVRVVTAELARAAARSPGRRLELPVRSLRRRPRGRYPSSSGAPSSSPAPRRRAQPRDPRKRLAHPRHVARRRHDVGGSLGGGDTGLSGSIPQTAGMPRRPPREPASRTRSRTGRIRTRVRRRARPAPPRRRSGAAARLASSSCSPKKSSPQASVTATSRPSPRPGRPPSIRVGGVPAASSAPRPAKNWLR